MSDITNDDVVNFLGNMSVMQVIALTKELEEKWGVKAVPQTVQQIQPRQDEPKQEAQTEFNVVLTSVPADKKMAVLKMVRELTGLGLKESKDVVEGCPKVIKEGVSKEDAEAYRVKLVEAGGIVEVK